MCLSTVYEEKDGQQKKVCEFVSQIKASDSQVILTDIMGTQIVVRGTLKTLDFMRNIIIVDGDY